MAGEIVHIEFPSQDADRAASFWGGLFGWEFGDSMSPDFVYRMARTSDTSGAAVMASIAIATCVIVARAAWSREETA